MTSQPLGKAMAHQLPVQRSLILPCEVCSRGHDVRATGAYDVDGRILYRADDGSDHEWVADVRITVSGREQIAEARRQGFDIEPWDSR